MCFSTTSAKVIAVFHMPNTGLTSVLELKGVFDGAELVTSVELFHLVLHTAPAPPNAVPMPMRTAPAWRKGAAILVSWM